jgi:hypothetical protein
MSDRASPSVVPSANFSIAAPWMTAGAAFRGLIVSVSVRMSPARAAPSQVVVPDTRSTPSGRVIESDRLGASTRGLARRVTVTSASTATGPPKSSDTSSGAAGIVARPDRGHERNTRTSAAIKGARLRPKTAFILI